MHYATFTTVKDGIMESRILLKAQGIVKKFYSPTQLTILDGVDLTVCAGDSIAIGGRSGEGKSTLLQILGILDTPSAGELQIMGTPASTWNSCSLRSQHIGFIFQSFYLLSDYSALENVLMAARIARKPTGKGTPAYLRAIDLLERVGLSDRLHHSTKLLSGGEKQRVAIARALCNDPSLIMADEPTGNLDKQTAEEIYALLLETVRNEGKALIVVTHDPLLMQRCALRYHLSHGTLKPMSAH